MYNMTECCIYFFVYDTFSWQWSSQWWTEKEENGIKHGLTAWFIILAGSIQSQF